MNIDKLETWQSKDVERRLRRKQGEVIEVPYSVWSETVDERGDLAEVETRLTARHFIGRMNPDQTGPVLAVLASVFFTGADAQANKAEVEEQAAESGFNFSSLLKYLKGDNLVHLAAAILGEDAAWVHENWDLKWVLSVAGVFFKYNDFFGLLNEVASFVSNLSLSIASASETPTSA